MKKKNGFTLIELIAVLVILAILALIVTPLVMNIIRKAKVSADRRSVDAYGRSAELAIASYLLDNGKFPTSIDQLTIEYSGDTVECETTQINPDSSIYLAGCKVKNRNVEGYTYGNDKQPKVYSVGDTVSYNGINYYVLKDSGANELTVNLLKAEPLSYEDVQTYSAGTGADISNRNGYGGMQYGNTNTYSTSYVKTVVDAWKTAKAPLATEARLITKQEIDDNFDFEQTMREEKQITYNIKKMMNDTKYLEIVKKHNKKDYVDLDDTVSIKFIYDDTDEIEEYKLTGKYISNNNEITLNSPLGNAIYNKKIGSTIIYKVNNKEIKVQIIKKII